jgi:hypothetical protein
MTQTQFNHVHETAVALDQKINQLQNSAGVMSDEDQAALNSIETASKQILQAIDDLNQPDRESVGHKEAVRDDKQVRPGETAAQHATRMEHTYPDTKVAPAPPPGLAHGQKVR